LAAEETKEICPRLEQNENKKDGTNIGEPTYHNASLSSIEWVVKITADFLSR
jgi:hypothetical protein